MNRKYLIVITGPTAVGKTPLSIELAKHFHTEIISADSRQIYREMKIGTATPSADQLAAVPHHFIGTRSVQEYYNASMFEWEVLDLLNRLFKHYDRVIMTGGSGMYVDAVCRGIDDFPTVDNLIRTNLKEEYHHKGIAWLREQISEQDPQYYMQVDRNNPNRLLKALEIITMTGRPYSSFLNQQNKERDFGIIQTGLNTSRGQLHEQINRRVDEMMSAGLVEEARRLYPYRHLNALNTVGYKELFSYFDGNISLEEAVVQIKNHTRQYARRQLTWFRKNKDIRWFDPGEPEAMTQYILGKTGG